MTKLRNLQKFIEVENYRPPMQAKVFHATQGIFYCAVITQSAKVICRLERLRTAHGKRQKAL